MPATTRNCTCPIKPGMDHFALRALGSGCTANLGYVCPVLTARRKAVAEPSPAARAADDLAVAKLVGLKPLGRQ